MSDPVTGAVVVTSGVAMLWCAREYIGVRMDFNRRQRSRWSAAGGRRGRLARYLFPVFPTAELVMAYATGVAVIVAGVVVFWL
jgi:hypothetical protein